MLGGIASGIGAKQCLEESPSLWWDGNDGGFCLDGPPNYSETEPELTGNELPLE